MHELEVVYPCMEDTNLYQGTNECIKIIVSAAHNAYRMINLQ